MTLNPFVKAGIGLTFDGTPVPVAACPAMVFEDVT